MQTYAYFNGKITPLNKIKINPYDLGFLRGYGVFDFMVTANGKPFMLSDHWKRLQNSARELNLTIPLDGSEYEKTVNKLLKLNKLEHSAIRTILTGGISSDGITPAEKETFLITIEKRHLLPERLYKEGAKVITVEHFRDCPEAKTSNYIIAIKNIKKRIKEKAAEIIYIYQDKAFEASTSNFFIVKNSIIVTPKKDVLLGITRNIVIKLAEKRGYKVIEREISVKEIYSADEVFLTASNKFVIPVVKVNNKKIGSGRPGEMTKILMEEFAKFVKNY